MVDNLIWQKIGEKRGQRQRSEIQQKRAVESRIPPIHTRVMEVMQKGKEDGIKQ
jgi:hypothetical protein